MKTYSFDESFRFIVNFSNSESEVKCQTYYPMINAYNDEEWFEDDQTDNATNTVIVQDREYGYKYSLEKAEYLVNGNIEIDGTLNLSEIVSSTFISSSKLDLKLTLSQNDTQIEIPNGTIITIGGNEYIIGNDGILYTTLIESLAVSSYSENMPITLSFENVIPQNLLETGTYTLNLEFSTNGTSVETTQIPITLIKFDNYGFKATLQSISGINDDKLQLINYGSSTTRTIIVSIDSDITDAYIEVSILKQTKPFTYEESSETNGIETDIITQNISSIQKQDIEVTFGSSTNTGTYRVLVELYDSNGYKVSEDYVNFIVYE